MSSESENQAVAQWWADRLDDQYADYRDEFRRKLASLLDDDPSWQRLGVDYDPDRTLREALNAAGIDCRGFLFSARDILPGKTAVLKRPDGIIEAKEGYGAEWVPLEVGSRSAPPHPL